MDEEQKPPLSNLDWALETARVHKGHEREGYRCGWCAAKTIADAFDALVLQQC